MHLIDSAVESSYEAGGAGPPVPYTTVMKYESIEIQYWSDEIKDMHLFNTIGLAIRKAETKTCNQL